MNESYTVISSVSDTAIRTNRLRARAHEMRRRVRFTRRRIEQISRTATLGGLFLSFLKIGLVGFGGGVAVLAQIRALTVRKRRWLTDSEFAETVALAQSLPGTSAGNSVTYIGVRLLGWRGAIVAMSGFILPSMLIMIGLAIVYKHVQNFSSTERFFHGLNGAVVALILVTAWRMGKSILTKGWQWLLALNPMAGIIDAFRSSLLGRPWNMEALAISSVSALVLLVYGLFYFRKTERRFADVA